MYCNDDVRKQERLGGSSPAGMDEREASESGAIWRNEPLLWSRWSGDPVVAGESEDDCQQLGGQIGERGHASMVTVSA